MIAELDEAPGVGDADPADAETGPQRRCVVTRAVGPRARMLRFVLGPDRRIVPDLAARLPGRGLWLSARADVVEAAQDGRQLVRAFARAAKGPVVVPDDLGAMIRAGLERRVMEQLGLARRAGQAVAGFTRVREWLAAGRVGLIVQAADGSAEERRRVLSGAGRLAVCWPLTAAALGQVFGRDAAVHAAIAPGRIAEAIMDDVYRLAGVTGTAMVKAGE